MTSPKIYSFIFHFNNNVTETIGDSIIPVTSVTIYFFMMRKLSEKFNQIGSVGQKYKICDSQLFILLILNRPQRLFKGCCSSSCFLVFSFIGSCRACSHSRIYPIRQLWSLQLDKSFQDLNFRLGIQTLSTKLSNKLPNRKILNLKVIFTHR